MKDFIFQETSPDDELKVFDFEPSLFHNPRQLQLQRTDGWIWYRATHPRHKRVVASFYLNIEAGTATSAVKSPFGTVEHSRDLPPEVLYQFLRFVETRLLALNVRRVIIKNPPQRYAPFQIPLLETFLHKLGYSVAHAENGATRETQGEFVGGLNRLERRKLRKAQTAGLQCRLLPSSQLEQIYTFIRTCRQRKGYSLSMSLTDLQTAMETFPERYLLFGVFLDDALTGASISVQVSAAVLYNFYADHAKPYDALSPVVTVVEGLYHYCQQHTIPLLDLGTSDIDTQPNFGLFNFKLRLGGQPTSKLTFEKILTP